MFTHTHTLCLAIYVCTNACTYQCTGDFALIYVFFTEGVGVYVSMCKLCMCMRVYYMFNMCAQTITLIIDIKYVVDLGFHHS